MKAKRLITSLLVFVMLFSAIPYIANAQTNHTQAEAVAWITARRNEAWAQDKDGAYGAQCVDLIHHYLDFWGVPRYSGSAYTYTSKSLPSGWVYTKSPSPGDIAVWGIGVGISRGNYGHVALVETVSGNNFSYVGVNGSTGKSGCGTTTISNPSTFIHPYYSGTSAPTPAPTPAPIIKYANIPLGKYFIRHNSTGKYLCLGEAGKSTNVWVWERNGYTYEFEMEIASANSGYRIIPTCQSKVMNVYADTVTSGKNVNVYADGNNGTQWWGFEAVNGGYVIRNISNPSVCLSIDSSGYNVYVATYTGASNQIWSLETATPAPTPTPTPIPQPETNDTPDVEIEDKQEETYTVTYNANGGKNAPAPQTQVLMQPITISYDEPTRNGYTFLGWSETKTANGSYVRGGDEITCNGNATLYAMWEKEEEIIAETCWLFYDANGGIGASAPLTEEKGTVIYITDNEPTRNGYTFLGWSESEDTDCVDFNSGDRLVLNDNMTLYAVWENGSNLFANSKPSDWAVNEVEKAIRLGLVPENLQKNYTMPVYRLEVAGMFINLIEEISNKDIDTILKNKGVSRDKSAFTDTQDEAVLSANALGIIKGVGNNTFDCYGTLTRGEITAIINRTANVLGIKTTGYAHNFTDVKNHWCNNELGWPTHAGVINGVGNNLFAPNEKLTTEQAIAIVYRAYQKLQ